jgi:hypothetical protein
MYSIDERRLFYAARTSIALLSLAFDTLWSLYPDEMLALQEHDEAEIIEALKRAVRRTIDAPMTDCDSLDPEDIF